LQRLLATVKRALRTRSDTGRSSPSCHRPPGALAMPEAPAQLAQARRALMLRGERGMRADLFARLLVLRRAVPRRHRDARRAASELLAKAAGGVLSCRT